MQNKVISILAAVFLLSGCLQTGTPYGEGLNTLTVRVLYPEGYSAREGAGISIESVTSSAAYRLLSGAGGSASTRLPNGIYRISVSDREGSDVFNGTLDKLVLSGQDLQVDISLIQSKAGGLVIKELYCGGCSKMPEEGTYQSDQYVIVHNNDDIPTYLDGLCLGTLSPYNSNAANPWLDKDGNLPSFIPVIQAVWMIGGTGSSFPLEPGADAVICLRGAINHAAQYPLSVNLNLPDVFVCYNPTYFPNPTYHPAPGDQVKPERYAQVVIKTGQSNANTFSLSSPTVVLFRTPMPAGEYVLQPDVVRVTPGNSADRVVVVPYEWIVDAVEVFDGRSSSNGKRIAPAADAGFVIQSDVYKGHTLRRKVDEKVSAENGYEVLMDTNNSSNDFYESEIQSLHP